MNVQISEVTEQVSVIQGTVNQVQISETINEVEIAQDRVSVVTIIETRQVPQQGAAISVVSIPEVQTVVISERGPQGVQGEPGAGGTSTDVVYPAGEAIGGHRCVVVEGDGKAYYASRDELSHMNKVLGITTGAAAINANATVRAFGEMTEPSWNWILDQPIFLGVNGLLTQMPPTSGFSLIVAFPITATKIFVEIKEPILLQ